MMPFAPWRLGSRQCASHAGEMEADAAQRSFKTMRLTKHVECDATGVWAFHVSPLNEHFAAEVAEWRKRHPSERWPPFIITHLRVASLAKREKQGQSKRTGTQMLDRRWGHLKRFIPNTLHSKSGHQFNERVLSYVHAWTWRQNQGQGQDLWHAVGRLASKKMRCS